MKEKNCKNRGKGRDELSFSIFSDTRAILMGIATLMVVLFHVHMYPDTYLYSIFPTCGFSLSAIDDQFSAGVDSFLFLSGLGLYYSWSKEPKLKSFYKNGFYVLCQQYLL